MIYLLTNVAKTQNVPLDGTIFFANTGQRDKTNWYTFIEGLLTMQDQELFEGYNKRKRRQQYRKSCFSLDKTAP